MKAYENYADTDIFWHKSFPAHWKTEKISRLFSQVKNKNVGMVEKNLLSLSYGTVKRRGINATEGLLPESFEGYNIIEADDIVLRLTDLQNDKRSLRTGIAKERGIITSAYITIRNKSENSPLYMQLFLHTFDLAKGFYNVGAAGVRQGLKWDDIKKFEIAIPPRSEQDQIVCYLDWQVSKINKLIAAKKKEIAILKEYKERRVTEKLSGENVWLKRLLIKPLQYGANSSGTAYDPNLPRYIRITDIDLEGNLKKEGAKSLSEEEAEPYILEDGDILLARSGATVGKAFLYKREFGLSAYAGYLIRAKFDKVRLLPEYFMYFTNSSAYQDWKDSVFIRATIQNISADKYGRLPIPLPSIEEQKQIVGELNAICKNIDSLIEIRHKEIRKVQELKAKLISDVVTGQIDVRGIEVPDFEYVEDIEESSDEDENSEETSDDEEV